MDRTQKVIKYLEEYRHHCYIRLGGARYKNEEEHYRERYKDIGNIIKELKEHGCRRTCDRDITIPETVYVPTLIKLPPDGNLHWYTMQEVGGIETKEQLDKLKYMHGMLFTNPDECKEWIKEENERCQLENAKRP